MTQPNFQHFIIDNIKLFKRLTSYAEKVKSDLFVLDVETDNVNEKLATPYGIGVCFNSNKAFYIALRDNKGDSLWNKEDLKIVKTWIKKQAKTRKLIGHNIIYDVLVLESIGLYLTDYIYSDTILQKHALDEERPFGLKEVSVALLGDWADIAQEKLKEEVLKAGGKWIKNQKDMYLASTKTLGEYCCWDVILTYLLFNKFEPKLIEEGLYDLFYKEEIMPLYKTTTINMKRRGFHVAVEYFEKLRQDIKQEIDSLEDSIYQDIEKVVSPFEKLLLDKKYPAKPKGKFPKVFAEVTGMPLPINKKTGKVTLAAKAVEKQKEASGRHAFYDWLLGLNNIDVDSPAFKVLFTNKGEDPILTTQKRMFKANNPDSRHVFNLRSNDHLIELFIHKWGFSAIEKTEGGKPKVDDKFLDFYKGNPVIDKLIDFKKLNKLLSTYIEGILDRQLDGVIYTSMLQFGTTSGRYSSRNPNLQNLPRPIDPKDAQEVGISTLVLKYINAIRTGFIAPKGYKIVDADYSALEPRCFAHVSGDQKLRDVFIKGEDLYARIAIDVFKLSGVSANPDSPNFLKKLQPEFRQKAKVFCLAVVYGAEEARISQAMKVSFREAKKIINAYLSAYPGLRSYMSSCNYKAKTNGKVTTEFGRIRHLGEAKSIYTLYGPNILDYKHAKRRGQTDLRRKLKNCLNNSKNFPIQGLAAHIVNRAAIEISKQLLEEGLDAYLALQVHDQLLCVAREDQAQRVSEIMQEKMENTTKISIPLIAQPQIANNMAESH